MSRLGVTPWVRKASRGSRAAGRFWSYCWGTLAAPRRTTEVIHTSATAGDGVTMVSIFGGLYALAAFTSYWIGRKPSGRILKMIPAERYYLWESVFCLPMTLLWFTLFAAFARRLSRRVGGVGRFGSDLTVLAFTQSMPMLAAMWLPDMICYVLRIDERLYRRPVAAYAPVAVAWAVVLSVQGLSVTERIRWQVALCTVLASELASATASGVAVAMR